MMRFFALFLLPAIINSLSNYYLAVEEITWDYAPLNFDFFSNLPLEQSPLAKLYTVSSSARIGKKYLKAVYRGYSDDAFTARSAREPWLGILGPVIRVTAGEELTIHLYNNATRAYSFYPHGLSLQSATPPSPPLNKSASQQIVGASSTKVEPGEKRSFTFKIPLIFPPGQLVTSPRAFLYNSDVNWMKDFYSGLCGLLLIYPPQPLPRSSAKEFAVLFSVFDESKSWYFAQNLKSLPSPPPSLEDEDFKESNKKHSMNGLLFGNLPGLDMNLNEPVRWIVASMGGEIDLHTAHWHATTLLQDGGYRVDVADLLPGTTAVLESQPDVPGTWIFHCHVNDHIQAGMLAFYRVLPSSASFSFTAAPSIVILILSFLSLMVITTR